MAEKLSITIALNGAEEIKRQLADVGKAGKDAFNEINQAAADVGGFNKLDVGTVTGQLEKAGVAGKDVAKVLDAVNQAGRMETLVNGLKAVENGFANIQTAASALDGVLLKGLTRSLTLIARLLPAAFGAAVVGSIASTTKAILELDAAAIKLGISIEDLSKAENIFKAMGLSVKDARGIVKGFVAEQGKIEMAGVKEAAANIDEYGRSLSSAKNWIKILEDGAKSADPVIADLAKNKLAEIGRTVPGISAAAKEIEKIQQSALPLPQQLLAILGVLEKMGPTAERTQIANRIFGPAVVQALNAGGVQLDLIRFRLASMPVVTQAAADAAARLSLAWERFKNLLASGFEVSPQALENIALVIDRITAGLQIVGQTMTAMFGGDLLSNTIREFQTLLTVIGYVEVGLRAAFGSEIFENTKRELQTISNLLEGLGRIGFAAMKYVEAGAIEVWNTIIGWIDAAIRKVREFFGAGGGQAAGAGAQGMARGGIMGGRGSGTSDSNLAWLSRGEHVMPAYAVRQPGVLQLLEALRRSGGNLRGVLDRMGHFAMGGLVGAPAFAGGGINGMSHVTIQFPGLPAIGGLRASSAVVDELRRSAALAQVRSGGRKPTRYI